MIPLFGGAFRRAIGSAVDYARRSVSVALQVPEYVRNLRADHEREVRIRALRVRMNVAWQGRDHISVAHLARQMFAECDARSPRALARLERRCLAAMDEHMREALGK